MRQWFLKLANKISTSDPEFIKNSRTQRQKRIDRRLNGLTRPFIWDDLFVVGQLAFLVGLAIWLLNTTTVAAPLWPLWAVIIVCTGLALFYLGSIWVVWRKLIKQNDEALHRVIDDL